jgi:hypothetical protein
MRVKGILWALVLSLVLAGVARQMAVVGGSTFCSTLSERDDPWLYWFFGCKDAGAGGGGSGVG